MLISILKYSLIAIIAMLIAYGVVYVPKKDSAIMREIRVESDLVKIVEEREDLKSLPGSQPYKFYKIGNETWAKCLVRIKDEN